MESEKSFDFSGFTPEERTDYLIKKLIDDYLELTKAPSMKEILDKIGLADKKGELTKAHIQVLQCMVKDYYTSVGKNLEDEAKASGITIVDGELSDLEKACIEELLNDYCKTIISYLNDMQ